jgi:hypothetical protein
MGVYEGRGQLSKSFKELMNRWAETRSSWDDQRSKEFQEKYLVPLEQDMRSAVAAMDHMATFLQLVRRDCQ